jgi:(S)-ureidoglycine aminohydrolase
MHHFGETRSRSEPDHALLTADTFVRAPLPGMQKCMAIVHAAPVLGAGFTQYTAEFESGGVLGPVQAQRFVFVLDGEVRVEIAGEKHLLAKDGYAYLPVGLPHRVEALVASRVAVIEKPYFPLEGVPSPLAFLGDERAIPAQPLMGDDGLEVRILLPADAAFDMAVNTMTYDPGATLPMVEIHVMEHGMLILEGGGIYRLGDKWYPVTAGDFIWMGPYCPQWFGALGKTKSRYLIYKDWNRHPLG